MFFPEIHTVLCRLQKQLFYFQFQVSEVRSSIIRVAVDREVIIAGLLKDIVPKKNFFRTFCCLYFKIF